MDIRTSVESKRGCGYRKPGGLYLIGGALAAPCGLLPFPLTVCPCCGHGVKPTRGFTWINSDIFKDAKSICNEVCIGCPIKKTGQKMGLIWVGEKFYNNPDAFVREAKNIGISRRISQIPKDLKVGKTWICFAHRKAVTAIGESGDLEKSPGIFQAFIPQRIEYVVTGKESEKELESLVKRGIELVKVVRDIDQQKALY